MKPPGPPVQEKEPSQQKLFDLEAELDKMMSEVEPACKKDDGDTVAELLRGSVEKMVAGDSIMD